MRPQVGSVCKRLLADVTGVWLVSCMRSQMPLKQPRSGECLSTKLTFVVEVVSEDVHTQSWHADIHLAANVTLLGVG